MKQSFLIFTTLCFFIMGQSLCGYTINRGKLSGHRGIKKNTHTKQRQSIGNTTKNHPWNIFNWYWLIEGSSSNMEDLLAVNVGTYLSPFPDYGALLQSFNKYNWNQWDSWKSIGVKKDTYSLSVQFDSQGKITEYLLPNNSKYVITYGAHDLPSKWVEWEWNNNQKDWVELNKYTFTYTKNGALSELLFYTYSNLWNEYEKCTYTYDAENNILAEVVYAWNRSHDEWVRESKWTFTYSSNNRLTEDMGYFWDETEWIPEDSTRCTYTYTNESKIKDCIQYILTSHYGKWQHFDKYSYTYDSKGNVSSETSSEWDEDNETWVNYGIKNLYTYDHNNDLVEESFSQWNKVTNSWIPYGKKYTYAYTHGNLTEEIDFNWNNQEWEKHKKYEFSYNTADGSPQLCKIFSFIETDNEWELNEKHTICYNESIPIFLNKNNILKTHRGISLIRKNLHTIEFTFDFVSHEYKKMRIFTLQGKMISELFPIYQKGKTVFQWDKTSSKKLHKGNQILLYEVQGDGTILKGVFGTL